MSRLGRGWKDFDLYILITTVILMGFGAVTIYSADGGGPIELANLGVRQAVYGALGIAVMLVVASVDYRILGSLSWAAYGVSLLALLIVLVPGVGIEIAGSRRWFDLGFTTVQPSEFAKVATVLALASFVASRGPAMRELGNFLVSLLIVLAPMALVFRQPDLGTSLVYGVIWVAVMTVTQTQKRFWLALAAAAPAVVFVGWEFLLADYQKRRWTIFLNPEVDARGDGFNLIQARISIGSGGWRGYGIEGGTQSQLGLLKVRESDFIFAHASGMFGFVGMTALMLMFGILIWRCLHVSEVARDSLGQAIAIGITGMLFFQAFVNIGMNIGLMPVTGVTLPFISAGLSSLWTFLIAEGLLQSVLIRQRKLAFQPT
ncbi:MAG: cell cycle protein [Thermomicrobiales bacterium]|jgi:rod shape determining protein RodA|nr:cell cycle protein [Thermomicrobiales bacterium]